MRIKGKDGIALLRARVSHELVQEMSLTHRFFMFKSIEYGVGSLGTGLQRQLQPHSWVIVP